MKIADLAYGQIETIEVQQPGNVPFQVDTLRKQIEVNLVRPERVKGTYLRLPDEIVWPIEGAGPQDEEILTDAALRRNQCLAWIVSWEPAQRPTRLLLQLHNFPQRFQWPQTLDVGVDDRIVERVQHRYDRRARTPDRVLEWLAEEFLLPGWTSGAPARTFVSAGPDPTDASSRGFRLHGSTFMADLYETGEKRLQVKRILRASTVGANAAVHPILMAAAPIQFCDATAAGRFQGEARTQLTRLARQADSYLSMWREYNELEWKSLLHQAQDFGLLQYGRVEDLPGDRFRFYLQPKEGLPDRLVELCNQEDTELEAASQAPEDLRELIHESSADATLERESIDFSPPTSSTRTSQGKNGNDFCSLQFASKGVDPEKQTLTLKRAEDDDDRTPPEKGYLYVSLHGHEVRLDRRRKAEELIRRASNPMPQLGLLLEGQPAPGVRRAVNRTVNTQNKKRLWQVRSHLPAEGSASCGVEHARYRADSRPRPARGRPP